MAKFCTVCGRALADGEVCSCARPNRQATNRPNINFSSFASSDFARSGQGMIRTLWEKAKVRMGICEPELCEEDAFEDGKRIVPDCISSVEGEIPVRQYTVAKLRNTILGIPYARAKGRVQVTNKRVIFRAAGNSISGRTTTQHEFDIQDLSGVEARKEHVFNPSYLLLGLLGSTILFALLAYLSLKIFFSGLNYDDKFLYAFLTLLIGGAGMIPFCTMKKHWIIKAACASLSSLLFQIPSIKYINGDFIATVYKIFGIVATIFVLFSLFLFAMRANVVVSFKTKNAGEGISVRRKLIFPIGMREYTGFSEVLPSDDINACIQEINSVINDVQKLGDDGVRKWIA